jgi:hypothetical protein
MEGGSLERDKPILGFFDTLESGHNNRISSVVGKPMRGGFVEARSQGSRGEFLGGA